MFRRLFAPIAIVVSVSAATAAELPKTSGWVEARTTHFTLYSSAGAQDTKKIAIELERFREALGRITKGFVLGAETPTAFHVFRNDSQFTPYKPTEDGRPANISGYFAQRPFQNYVALDASADSGMRVVFHEYVHGVLHRTFARVPSWLDEGLAEFYSTFRFNALSNNAEIGRPIPEHVQHMGLHPSMDAAALLASEAPAHDDSGRQGTFYAQSWLLVHYLMTDEARRARLGTLLGRLKDGADPDEAVGQALGTDLAALQEDLREYQRAYGGWFKLTFEDPIEKQKVEVRDMTPGEVLYRLGDLLANLGPPSAGAARAHLEAALAQGGPAAPIRAAMGTAAEASGDLAEAERQYRLATEAAGADARVYARRGRFVLQRFFGTSPVIDGAGEPPGPVLEARALLQKSVELDPDGVEALAALGRTYRFGAAGASDGLEALGRANALRPDRLDVLSDLACMLAKSGRGEAAWAVLKNQLAPRADDPAYVYNAELCIVNAEQRAVNERVRRGEVAAAIEMLSKLESRLTGDDLRRDVASYRSQLQDFGVLRAPGIGSLPPQDAARIVDEYNRAVGLLEDGKHEEGLALLEPLVASCADGELCERIRSTADSVRGLIERNRIVNQVNEAITLLNSGKRKAAIEKLRALEQESTVPELTARIREMLDELGAR